MNFSTYVYRESLPAMPDSFFTRLRAAIFQKIRRLMIKIRDATVVMDIHGKNLLMPLSHELPMHISAAPHYGTLLTRVADYLRATRGCLNFVDVGANIGDTAVACQCGAGDTVLAVEPNLFYRKYLAINLAAHVKNYAISGKACGETDACLKMETEKGTARFVRQGGGENTEMFTLDSILKEQDFRNCNFLKIDTDGYDFTCLRGAADLLRSQSPFVLFEADVFFNTDYLGALLETLGILSRAGYTHALVYTHLGVFFSCVTLDNPTSIIAPAFHQLIGGHLYFDLLAVKNDAGFIKSEIAFFAESAGDESRRENAILAGRQLLGTLGLPNS